MNKILKYIIKDIILYWFTASIIMFIYSSYINNKMFKVLSIISTLISKLIYDEYSRNFYLNYDKPKIIIEKFKLDKVK